MKWNVIGFRSLILRELKRTFSIINQVVWPPIVSTLLFVLIIGMSLGSRIQADTGVSYMAFLIPGLIVMTVIESSYAESSASLFQHRFMNSIQELLTAPLAYYEIVLGFVLGSMARALLLGNLLLLFLPVFAGTWPSNWFLYLLMMALISITFSGIGLVMALLAEKWDHIAIPQTFAFMPLIWVGSAFTPLHLLPAPLQTLAYFNPMFYLIDGFRFALVGTASAPVWASVLFTILAAATSLGVVLKLFKDGYKLRV
ncbi:MAG: ABC transporter permease [Candidatus Sericytochromatia bacterium]